MPLLKSRKGLAGELGVSREIIRQMEAAGLRFPANKCTVDSAIAWLDAHPDFRATWSRKKKPATSTATEEDAKP